MSSIETQKGELAEAVESFGRLIGSLDEKTFLGPLGRWSARDVVAHLIGWNRYTVQGRGRSFAESFRSTTSIPVRTMRT